MTKDGVKTSSADAHHKEGTCSSQMLISYVVRQFKVKVVAMSKP